MGLFNNASQEAVNKFKLRIRQEFDESVKTAVTEQRDLINDPFTGGLMVHSAIAECYKSLKESEELSGIASLFGVDFETVMKEECQYAMNKYLEKY